MDEILNLCASFLLKLTLAALGALMSAYIIPYLKEKKLYGLLKKLVSAAEKLALSCAIPKEEKKSYVISRLHEYGIKVTPFIEALIEAAVFELDITLGKNESQTPPSDELTSDARPYEQNCDDTVGETATPHPSLPTANPPSPEGEGTNRLLPREKLSAELTDEGVEEETATPHPSLPTANPPSPEGEGTNRLLPREKLSAELTDEGVEEDIGKDVVARGLDVAESEESIL